eukprot:1180434-Prorocentrum_minimum.AAC.5
MFKIFFFPPQALASHATSPGAGAVLVAVMAMVLLMIVLSFFATIVLDIVNVVYICYAMDKDSNCVTRTEVRPPPPSPRASSSLVSL